MSLVSDRKELDTTIGPDGMQKSYLILSDTERAKGFVRPFRDAYRHVGVPGPRGFLRPLTDEEKTRYAADDYVEFEEYPPVTGSALTGRYWTRAQLDSFGKGCGKITTMARALAETYQRDQTFYSGTFCSTCKKHFPVGPDGEFTWYEMDGTEGPRVGT